MKELLINKELLKSNLDLRSAIKIFENKDKYNYYQDDMYNLVIDPLESEETEYYLFEWDGDYNISLPKEFRHFLNLLEDYGISGYRLAKETGIAQSTISDYALGLTEPSNIITSNIVKIADTLELSIDTICKYLKIK